MPPQAQILFDRLPFDGKLYRVQWAGAMRVDEADPTAVFHLWLAEVEEKDGRIVGLKKSVFSEAKFAARRKSVIEQTAPAAREDKVLPNVVWIDELAGSIPQLPIGSLWRDKVNVPDVSFPGDELADFTVDAPEIWEVVNSNRDVQIGHPKKWQKLISPHDYDLMGVNRLGGPEYFNGSPLVRCEWLSLSA